MVFYLSNTLNHNQTFANTLKFSVITKEYRPILKQWGKYFLVQQTDCQWEPCYLRSTLVVIQNHRESQNIGSSLEMFNFFVMTTNRIHYLLRQSTSTCFGHIYCPSSRGIHSICTATNTCYMFKLTGYWPGQSFKRITGTSCCTYTVNTVSPVAQSVQRQAMGWTVRGSNTGGGEIFRTCPDRSWGPPSLLYNRYRVFPGSRKRPGRDADGF
jgi:hypothetical protein